MIVSFLMESEVRMILDDLEQALNRGVKIRIPDRKLSGNYTAGGIVSNKGPAGRPGGPSVLQRKGRSFTLKLHIRRSWEIHWFINVSRNALTSGIEWNYHFDDRRDSRNFSSVLRHF